MMIQVLLILGLLLCLAYAFLQREKSHFISAAISTVSLVGIYLVLAPDRSNQLAHFVGVGRGADLIVYCWLVISLTVSVNLQFKILTLQGYITELARELALRAPLETSGASSVRHSATGDTQASSA